MRDNHTKIQGKLKAYLTIPLILIIVFAACAVCMYFVELYAGLACTAFVVVYAVVVIVARRGMKKNLLQYLVDFATGYATVQKHLLEEMDIPYALLDDGGKLLWFNEKFAELTGKEKNYRKSITSLYPEITKERLAKDDEMDILIERKKQILRAHVEKIYLSDEILPEGVIALDAAEKHASITTIYILDETELGSYKKRVSEMQMVSGLIYIDNYDEVVESLEEVKQSLLMALIDRKVNRYFANVDAVVKKTEKDKYFVVMRREYLDDLREKRFSLLEDIKSIKLGNDISVTLSMGFGIVSDNFTKNYEYARIAIEMALGRGGDQAVLKTPEQTYYFGGNAERTDKSTRVKARVKALAMREIMMSRDNVYVMGHSITDVDCLGAAVGIYVAAQHLGKQVRIVIDEVNTTLKPFRDLFSPENGYRPDMFISAGQACEEIRATSMLVVVDTNRPSHTVSPELLARAKTVVVFDHHRAGEEAVKGAVLSYTEPYASSTCEMIAEMLPYFDENIKLNQYEADTIYAGILIDTNNFVSKTGVRTFEAAAYLRRCGADVTRVRKLLRYDIDSYRARAEAIRRTEVYRNAFAISTLPAHNVAAPTVAGAQAANELLNVIGIRASFILTEFDGRIYISARSIDDINVQRIMEKMGGGGHMNTAGAQLRSCTMDEAMKKLQATIDEMIKEGDIKL